VWTCRISKSPSLSRGDFHWREIHGKSENGDGLFKIVGAVLNIPTGEVAFMH
jgi:hypothetical protein